jgi:hypothetical protein
MPFRKSKSNAEADADGVRKPLSPTPPKGDPALLTRRGLVLAGAGSVALAAGGTWFYLQPGVAMTREDVLITALRTELTYLQLDAVGLHAFASRYLEWLTRQPYAPSKPQEDLIQRYLLSTDFFPAADESRPVHFVALHDPYSFACVSLFGAQRY